MNDCVSAFDSIRIRPELRAAQVERAVNMTPALTLYFDEKYDLGSTILSSAFRKVGLFESMRILCLSNASILEVPEPLWLRFLPKTVALAWAWKISGVIRKQKRMTVTYAIENNDLGHLLSPGRRLPRPLMRLARFTLGRLIRGMIDRIAYGSSASAELYKTLGGVTSISSVVIEELPARLVGASTDAAESQEALFIGELDRRKGITHLMHVWPKVEESMPKARLTIVGSGVFADEVESWCKSKPDSRAFAGFVQHEELPRLLESSNVLVAPSCRDGRWREQIGLPIVEALAAGLTVVTTEETGLAPWLRGNGHFVIREKDIDFELGAACQRALESPMTRNEVRESLPAVAGRITSDAWLHSR